MMASAGSDVSGVSDPVTMEVGAKQVKIYHRVSPFPL